MSDKQNESQETNNTLEDAPMEIKEENTIDIKIENEFDMPNDNPFENIEIQVKQENEKDKQDENFEKTLEVKEEISEDIISYDYPNFEDSMDSNDATALGNVEACLQDENHFEQEKELLKDTIKEEDVTVTETHLVPDTIDNSIQIGVIQSDIDNSLLLEIKPVENNDKCIPEEILPTSYENDMDVTEPFQLNSITGNVLSLEQEAYGLLKAKKQKVLNKNQTFPCDKCCKVCQSPYSLKRHLDVHQSIENYELGRQKGRLTRIENSKRNQRAKKSIKKVVDRNNIEAMKARQERLERRHIKLKVIEEKKLLAEVAELNNKEIKKDKKDGYECTCGQIFQRRSRMETCFRSHDMDNDSRSCFSCISCSKQFQQKEELVSHRRRLHRKRFPCKFCPTDYHTRKELFKHLRMHQKVQLMELKVISEVVNGKQELRCFMCEKSYSELTDLKNHVMEDHKEPYVCPKCNETFSKIIDFGQHTKTNHPDIEGQSVLDVLEAFSKLVKAWKCEECDLQFHDADKLAKHQVEMHSPELRTEAQFQCDDCRRVFISQKGLTSHRRIHHNTGSEETQVIQGVICVECRKICKDETALASHMRLHSPERKYPCKFCDFRFATPEKRKAHAELHTGDMKYVCFICEYQCTSENRLRLHKMSDKHKNMKEFLISGKAMNEQTQNGDQNLDSGSESSGDEEIFCDICGEKFRSTEKMLKHKETHPFIEFPNDDTPTRIFFK